MVGTKGDEHIKSTLQSSTLTIHGTTKCGMVLVACYFLNYANVFPKGIPYSYKAILNVQS